MILMHVVGLSVDSATKTPMVVLQGQDGQESLSIWIGAMEAMAISLALSGSALPRPLTHDLLLTTLNMLGGSLEGVEIHDMREGTYHADLLLQQGQRSIRMDCRPSDAIALALRVGAPIHVSAEVMRRSGSMDHSDPASPRHLRPQDAATDMMRQAAARMTAAMTGVLTMDVEGSPRPAAATGSGAGTGADSPVVAGASAAAEGDTEDQRLAELLQLLEPESSRRM